MENYLQYYTNRSNKYTIIMMISSGVGFSLIAYFTFFSVFSFLNLLDFEFNHLLYLILVFIFSFVAGGIFTLSVDHNFSLDSLRNSIFSKTCTVCLKILSTDSAVYCQYCNFSYHSWHLLNSNLNLKTICLICTKPVSLKSQNTIINEFSPLNSTENKLSPSRIIIVDGNNVAFETKPPSISNILSAEQILQSQGFEPITIISASLKYRISEKDELKQMINSKRLIQAPSGSYDDSYIIETAKQFNAFILSNDRFRDLKEHYPWINQRRIAFTFVKNKIIIAKMPKTNS